MLHEPAVPFAHRLQRSRYTGCFVRKCIPSAIAMSSGIPIPNAAKMMWKASDMAICDRAKRKSLIPLQGDRFQVSNQPEGRQAIKLKESRRVLIICGRRETRDVKSEALLSAQDAVTGSNLRK